MILKQAQEKYLNRVVEHKKHKYSFRIWYIIECAQTGDNRIQFIFENIDKSPIGLGYPQTVMENDMVDNWQIISNN